MSGKRRLAAIVAGDIAGYSRMMRENEARTYDLVKRFKTQIILPALAAHGGRLIKDMGDGFLAMFDSAVQAVECSMAIQGQMGEADFQLRIGVNLGDVIVEDDDIYGDGVNIAARLEGMCQPGGICMSANIHEEVRDKLRIEVTDLGLQKVKNIDRPLGVHLWTGAPAVRPRTPDMTELMSLEQKPSIAVLAFDNMSRDPDQAFFAEGISEDIITALSRIDQFFVVSRISSFSYRGQSISVQEISRGLGVRYVLEGSVRSAGGRLRVTAQLIDAETGNHVWAEKYDRLQDDIFDIQDEIVQNVVASMQTHISVYEGRQIALAERMSLPAWKLVILASSCLYEFTEESLQRSMEIAEQALALDPANASAYRILSIALYHVAYMTYPLDADAMFDRALELAERAVRLAPKDETGYWARGLVLAHRQQLGRAISDYQRALEINPNYSVAWGCLSSAQGLAGLPDEAIASAQVAMRSNPRDPSVFFRYGDLAVAHFLLDDFAQTETWARKAITMTPGFFDGHLLLVAALQARGQGASAQAALADCARHCGEVSVRRARAIFPFQNKSDEEAFIGLLTVAGLT